MLFGAARQIQVTGRNLCGSGSNAVCAIAQLPDEMLEIGGHRVQRIQ